jgi:hypothetical protein
MAEHAAASHGEAGAGDANADVDGDTWIIEQERESADGEHAEGGKHVGARGSSRSLGIRLSSHADVCYTPVDGAPEVPTRAQWSNAKKCKACDVGLTLLGERRRAHCRRCGGAVCRRPTCSSNCFWALVDHKPARTCAVCLSELQSKHGGFVSAAPRTNSGGQHAPPLPPPRAHKEHHHKKKNHGQQEEDEEFNAAELRASADVLAPILIVPGFASSVLEVHRSASKPAWEGEAVWVAMGKLVEKKLFTKGEKGVAGGGSAENASSSSASSADADSGASIRGVREVQAALADKHSDGTRDDEGGGGGGKSKASNSDENKTKEQEREKLPAFRVLQETTQQRLAKSHPLVRHITLGDDGFSDPPGIKVRARGGIEAVKCVMK